MQSSHIPSVLIVTDSKRHLFSLGKLFEKLKTLNQQELESVVGVVDVMVKQKGQT